ncbi:hypothetical protein C2G38_2156863 [Gigaspora rosea]|uniref:TLDc domain-containing protein n=1 Tax=Gigaspora rosea TaxID=44941 RepID=A0A397W497_9GLOM|nr:hypothetical protein C2G38_2156863 [Gigaspora rosea]
MHLVVIIKVKGNNEILGSYNSICWDKLGKKDFCKHCKDSFIFSLRNSIIQNAINCNMDYGPNFGIGDLTMLMILINALSVKVVNIHIKTIRSESIFESSGNLFFLVVEYEIFQISKSTKSFLAN